MSEEGWAAGEFAGVELGDKRLHDRLIELAEQRLKRPNASIAQSSESAAGMQAAYRFFDNEAVGAEEILAGHYEASIQRGSQVAVVLAVQDTTILDYSHHPATKGLGYLNDLAHQGMLLHSTMLVTPERVPLGLIDQQVLLRDEADFQIEKEQRKQLPIAEKESWKWVVGLDASIRAQQQMPHTQVICVGDSESDVYDVFLKAKASQQALLVRAGQDRNVDGPGKHLWAHLEGQPLAGEVQIRVPRQGGGKNVRTATLEVRFAPVTLLPPLARAKEKLPTIAVWGVLAQEKHPPVGVEALQWLLLTTLPVTTFAEAQEVLGYYTARWVIETFHKVLKSGCRVEERQFADGDNLQRYLALDAVVAWRVLYLTMLARELPDLPCTAFYEPEEWQALYCFTFKVKLAPQTIPTLSDATRWVAMLGGYLGRKSDGPPGPMTIWRGLYRLADITSAWLMFHDS
jgi:hypothetical protein